MTAIRRLTYDLFRLSYPIRHKIFREMGFDTSIKMDEEAVVAWVLEQARDMDKMDELRTVVSMRLGFGKYQF